MVLPRAAWKEKKYITLLEFRGPEQKKKKKGKKASRSTEYFIVFKTPANSLLIFLHESPMRKGTTISQMRILSLRETKDISKVRSHG